MKLRLRHYARGNLLSRSEELEKSLRLARGDKHRFEHIEGLYDELALSRPIWADIYCLPGCHRLRFAVNVEQYAFVSRCADQSDRQMPIEDQRLVGIDVVGIR